jgi:tetratricopeptide (TPR) repeat protein
MGLPTAGAKPKWTEHNSPLVGPKPMLSIKLTDLSNGAFQTVLVVIFFMASCAAPINRKTSEMTGYAGYKAQQAGDWDAARRNYAKAVVNGELGNLPQEQMANLYYEYGRSLGATCFYDDSEKYLQKALDIDTRTNGPAYMSMLELVRLNLKTKNYSKVINYFEKLIPIYKDLNAEEKTPIGLAETYEDYSYALKETGDIAKAQDYEEKARQLRANNPGGFSITERTPYGTQCDKTK